MNFFNDQTKTVLPLNICLLSADHWSIYLSGGFSGT